MALKEKWPVLGRHERAAGWLRVWVDLSQAPRTIDAYARGLAESLQVCEDHGVDPVAANRAGCCGIHSRADRAGQPTRHERCVDRFRLRIGKCHDPAAASAGAVILRLLVEEGVRESDMYAGLSRAQGEAASRTVVVGAASV
ncbi:hypothetical protein, partial [Rhodococcus opacus]|uniref:hypothetical protein n=1 Tax=Rhodococcus opacus TaxID=37919 RepID=UPI00295589F2